MLAWKPMSEQPLDHISGRFAAPVMRSVMTVPVIVERFIEKAPGAGADVICLDLEDSVPPAEKRPRRGRSPARRSRRCRARAT